MEKTEKSRCCCIEWNLATNTVPRSNTRTLVAPRSRTDPGIPTWPSLMSQLYPLWHFLWCEWGRLHSRPREEAYCSGLPRLIPHLRPRSTGVHLCPRPSHAGGTFPATSNICRQGVDRTQQNKINRKKTFLIKEIKIWIVKYKTLVTYIGFNKNEIHKTYSPVA